MSPRTTPQEIGSTLFTLHDNHTTSSSDHWQVSQYFPLRPAGSPSRWSRASDLVDASTASLNDGRAHVAGDAVGGPSWKRLGRPVAASGTAPHLRCARNGIARTRGRARNVLGNLVGAPAEHLAPTHD